jgi:hypothetical protein
LLVATIGPSARASATLGAFVARLQTIAPVSRHIEMPPKRPLFGSATLLAQRLPLTVWRWREVERGLKCIHLLRDNFGSNAVIAPILRQL